MVSKSTPWYSSSRWNPTHLLPCQYVQFQGQSQWSSSSSHFLVVMYCTTSTMKYWRCKTYCW
jgi:hypothetical protein